MNGNEINSGLLICLCILLVSIQNVSLFKLLLSVLNLFQNLFQINGI